ncbi:MAG: pectinesterase family protein [Candidatus Thorarchaeota archaeon]
MIRKRNLDPSLVSWIMHITGLGPGIGNIFYVAANASAYEQKLLDDGNVAEANMFTTVGQAFPHTVAERNDVILVMPGNYAETTELAWNKRNTHLIGLGGPRSWNDYTEYGVAVGTTTAAVAETIDVTGQHCMFRGINFYNNAANAGNLAALNLDGYGCTFEGCSFDGAFNTTQCVAAAAALYIDSSGSQCMFRDCRVGNSDWFTRDSANSGQLSYVGTNTYSSQFEKCLFTVSSETADVALVRQAVANSVQKHHTFSECFFVNQSVNWANTLNRVFYIPNSPVTAQWMIINCISAGFTEYQSNDTGTLFITNMPAGNAGGGIGVEMTG